MEAPPQNNLYKFDWAIPPYPFPEDVFAHFTADSAGNFSAYMGGEKGATEMEWKDVSGQNHHATIYGTPELVFDDTFADGVKRKAVHFKGDPAEGKALDSIIFPIQSELGYDYSVFAVAGYRNKETSRKGKVVKYIGKEMKKIKRNEWISTDEKVYLPYDFTINFDLTAHSHVDKKFNKKTQLPSGRPAVVFVFGQKASLANHRDLKGRVPAVLFLPLNDTLIVVDGDKGNTEAGCKIKNFPMKEEVHVQIKIEARMFTVKVNGQTACASVRVDRSQKDGLDQNAEGLFLSDAILHLGGGHGVYGNRFSWPTADAEVRNFEVISNAEVGVWRRVFQAKKGDWCVLESEPVTVGR